MAYVYYFAIPQLHAASHDLSLLVPALLRVHQQVEIFDTERNERWASFLMRGHWSSISRVRTPNQYNRHTFSISQTIDYFIYYTADGLSL